MHSQQNFSLSEAFEEPRSLAEAERVLEQLAYGSRFAAPTAEPPPPDRAVQSELISADRLRQSEVRYRTLVEQIPAITFMASLHDGLNESEIYVSPHIETMLGFTQKEWLGDPFLWYRQLHPDDRQRWGEEFARTCASGVNFKSEYRFISRDNREVWVHGEARVVRDDDGRPLFLQGIAFDITESKLAEQALRRSAEELEQKVSERTTALAEASLRAEAASRARASFLANMSHEIRTPLNGIIGFADLLRRQAEGDEAERAEWLDIIQGCGKHLLALINDILDLSKIDAGKLNVENIVFSPVKIIDEVCLILRSKAEEKGLRLETVYDGPMPETILSDPTRLRQVLINIAGNAIKFTATGSVRITTRLDGSTPDKSKLVIQITDTGIGIPAAMLENIFDPFTQADSSITRQFGGTGLGLSISRRLAQQLGGGVAVESELGRGTTFTCEIATGSLVGVRLIEKTAGSVESTELEQPKATLPVLNYRLLVVDDGETNRHLIRVMLGRLGAQIVEAENGYQAIERAMAEPFDLILMDMQMPIMDGYTAAYELRAHGVMVPIIALTGNAMSGDEARCRAAGCSGYLAKPIEQPLLIKAVAAALLERQPAAPVRCPPERSLARMSLPASSARPNELVSTLPTDDADFRQIVAQFVVRLGEKLGAMQTALAADDLPELAELAHWLKGSGGSAGFPDFNEPAAQLENLARAGQTSGIADVLRQLQQIAARIVVE